MPSGVTRKTIWTHVSPSSSSLPPARAGAAPTRHGEEYDDDGRERCDEAAAREDVGEREDMCISTAACP